MADAKISALTALTGANVADDDVFPIVDTSVTTTKKITRAELGTALNVAMTESTTTGGTSITFSAIPAGVKKICMMGKVSTSGTSPMIVQLGDAGGIEATGYEGSVGEYVAAGAAVSNHNTGFLLHTVAAAAGVYHFTIDLTLENAAAWRWFAVIQNGNSNEARISNGSGSKALNDVLTQIRLTTVGGTDTFDSTILNVQYGW